MRVKMKVQMSGTRDGADWPDRGEEIDLPDDEAMELCRSDIAEPVSQRDQVKVEKADAPKGEERSAVTTKSGVTKQ